MMTDWGNGISFHCQEMMFRDGMAVYMTVSASKAVNSDSMITGDLLQALPASPAEQNPDFA
ncbi:MAG: hypothetical protein IPN90_03630 [Elusimicrobia bacterium]|nr:hypothetical protein [Elusimicrobiota bacterium]